MEISALLQKHFAICGIEISQKAPKSHSINVKNSRILVIICASCIFVLILLNEVSTFDECIDTLFRSISVGAIGILYAIVVWKSSNLFKFIKSLADIVEASEHMKYNLLEILIRANVIFILIIHWLMRVYF